MKSQLISSIIEVMKVKKKIIFLSLLSSTGRKRNGGQYKILGRVRGKFSGDKNIQNVHEFCGKVRKS